MPLPDADTRTVTARWLAAVAGCARERAGARQCAAAAAEEEEHLEGAESEAKADAMMTPRCVCCHARAESWRWRARWALRGGGRWLFVSPPSDTVFSALQHCGRSSGSAIHLDYTSNWHQKDMVALRIELKTSRV